MRPSFGVSKPASMRRSVVLPQPDGPSSAKNSPSRISSESRSTAAKPEKRLLTASKRTSTRDVPRAAVNPPAPPVLRFAGIAAASVIAARWYRMIPKSGNRFSGSDMRFIKLARDRTQNRYPLLLVARLHDPEKWEPVFGSDHAVHQVGATAASTSLTGCRDAILSRWRARCAPSATAERDPQTR